MTVHGRSNSQASALAPDRIDIFKETGRADRPLARSYPVNVGPDGDVKLSLTPIANKAVLCAALLEPIPEN